jgi:predicted NAD-dependent protein-ADP-ribosyltransferase YbiA (DUF1768 family)
MVSCKFKVDIILKQDQFFKKDGHLLFFHVEEPMTNLTGFDFLIENKKDEHLLFFSVEEPMTDFTNFDFLIENKKDEHLLFFSVEEPMTDFTNFDFLIENIPRIKLMGGECFMLEAYVKLQG